MDEMNKRIDDLEQRIISLERDNRNRKIKSRITFISIIISIIIVAVFFIIYIKALSNIMTDFLGGILWKQELLVPL